MFRDDTIGEAVETLSDVSVEEEKVALEEEEDDLISKLPKKLRKVIRKPN